MPVGASRTVPGTMDAALARWAAWADPRRDFDGVPYDGAPTARATERWRYWRCPLADGSKVNVTISAKGADRASIGIQHEKHDDAEAVARWRAFWKSALATL